MHKGAVQKPKGTACLQPIAANLHTTAPNLSRLQPLQVGPSRYHPHHHDATNHSFSLNPVAFPLASALVLAYLKNRGCAAKPSELSHRVPALPEKASPEYAGCSPAHCRGVPCLPGRTGTDASLNGPLRRALLLNQGLGGPRVRWQVTYIPRSNADHKGFSKKQRLVGVCRARSARRPATINSAKRRCDCRHKR